MKVSRLSLVMLALAVVVTGFSYRSLNHHSELGEIHRFEEEIEKSLLIFKSKLELKDRMLQGLVSYYQSSDHVSRQEFGRFVASALRRDANVQALEWIPKVEASRLSAFEEAAKNDGLQDFYIKQKNTLGQWEPVQGREWYFPVFYLEPLKGNEQALGFDLGSEPSRMEVLTHAMRTGKTCATSKIELVQDRGEQKQAGVLVFAPVYDSHATETYAQEHLAGFVLGVYRVRDMMENTIVPSLNKGISLAVYDGKAESEQVMFSNVVKDPLLSRVTSLDVFGREWVIVWQANELFVTEAASVKNVIICGFGFLFLVALALVIQSYAYRKEQVEQEVMLRTKELDEAQQRSQEFADELNEVMLALNTNAIISETDNRGKIIRANGRFLEISKYSEEDLLGCDHRILNSGEHDSSLFKDMWDTILRGEYWQGEIKNKAKDGSYYWVDTTIYPKHQKGKGIVGFVSIRYDITDKKEQELELIESRDQALKAERIKADFLANMSHEIRTPMNGILGYSELLLETPLNDEQREEMEQLHGSAESLLTILNDILDFSKIEAGKIELEHIPVDCEAIIDSTLALMLPKAESNGITLKSELPDIIPSVLGDPTRLKQIWLNLVSNAVKFTPQGVVVFKLNFRPMEDRRLGDVWMKTEIIDTGIGMSPDQVENIFQSFSQADNSTTRQYGGTGLGTTISKHLVEIMGGELKVESKLGVGSTFFFEIPMKVFSEKVQKIFDHPALSKRNYAASVILAEDNDVNQKLAIKSLSRLGIEVHLAQNGKEVLALVNAVQHDLILMDLQMPVMDGFLATQKLLNMGYDKPIIAMTANVMQQDRERVFEVGMKAFIPKPFKQSNLIDVLDPFLHRGSPDL